MPSRPRCRSARTRLTAFRRMVLPLILPGVVGGWMLAFIQSFDELTMTVFVATPGTTTSAGRACATRSPQTIDPLVARCRPCSSPARGADGAARPPRRPRPRADRRGRGRACTPLPSARHPGILSRQNTSDLIVVGGGLVGTALAYGAGAQRHSRDRASSEGDDAFRASRGNFGPGLGPGQGLRHDAVCARWTASAASLAALARGTDGRHRHRRAAATSPAAFTSAFPTKNGSAKSRMRSISRTSTGNYPFEMLDHAEGSKHGLPGYRARGCPARAIRGWMATPIR